MSATQEALQQARTKMIRYRVLAILQAGYPFPTGEGLIADVLVDADLQATQTDIRKALTYLADKDYLELTTKLDHWEAKLTSEGVDYLENRDMKDVGIARPVGA